MKLSFSLFAALLATSFAESRIDENKSLRSLVEAEKEADEDMSIRDLKGRKKGKYGGYGKYGKSGKKSSKYGKGGYYYEPEVHHLDLTFINQAFQQPFSPFFIMVHSPEVDPIYVRGQAATEELARLAEDGDPVPLFEAYKGVEGVYDVFTTDAGIALFVGETLTVSIVVPEGCVVTIASMAINTNDCFCAINGDEIYAGKVFDLDGLDSGTEINNELCDSIPGPACGETGNVQSGDGEGVVHVHRGFHGIGDLSEAGYDWRNPMLRVVVTKTPPKEPKSYGYKPWW